MRVKLSVCIPFYNEKAIIESSARTLISYLNEHFANDYELIFSDDGSTDGSAEQIRALNLPDVRVIGQGINRGKGAAVRDAVLVANGEIILFTDADLAYGTDVIGEIVALFENRPDTDLIIGSRNLAKNGYKGYPLWRKIASKLYFKILSLVGGLRQTDSQCGCKAFRNSAAKEIFKRCEVDGFAFDLEVLLWAKELQFQTTEIPVQVLYHGTSKIRLLRDSFKMLHDLSRIRRSVRRKKRAEEL